MEKNIEISSKTKDNRLSLFIKALDIMAFEIDSSYKIIDAFFSNPEKLYKPPEEFLGKSLGEIFPPDKVKTFEKAIKNVLKNNKKQVITYFLDMGNRTYWFEASILPFKKNTVLGVVRDISQDKANYDTVKMFSDIFYKNPSIIVITDYNGNIQYANPKFFEVTQYSLDEVMEQNPRILKSGRHDKYFYQNLWNTIKSNKTWHDIFINKKKNGEIFYEDAYISPIQDDDGKIIHFFKVAEDITSLIKAEKMLTEEKIKFDMYIKNSSAIMVAINKNGIIKFINPKACEVLGYKENEILNKNWIDTCIPKRKRDTVRKYLSYSFKNNNQNMRHKNQILCKNGDERTILWQNMIFNLDDSSLLIGSGIDITNQERDIKIKNILSKILYAVMRTEDLNEFYKKVRHELNKIIDATNMFIVLNDETSESLKLVFNIDEKDNMKVLPQKKTISDYVIEHNDPLYLTKDEILKLINENKFDLVGSLPEIWVGIPLKLKDKTIGVLGLQSYNKNHNYSPNDISILEIISYTIAMSIKYKQDEETIRKDLEEKNILLKEVHHRVKNNLQLILSILRMQSYFIKNEEVLALVEEDINRIKSLSLLQNYLYKNENIVDINIRVFFNKIIQNLRSVYLKNKKIGFNLDFDDLTFDANLLQPLGILINELVTNAIKHAFKKEQIGEITVSLKKENSPDEKFILIVKDNGIGLPEDIDMENFNSFGLMFAKMQIDQIQGELQLIRDNGTTFIIKFKRIKLSTFGRI